VARKNVICFGSYVDIYNDLLELYMSVFKWSNLPPNVSERYLEETLMNSNKVIFYRQKNLDADGENKDLICLKASMIGMGNVYGDPVRVMAIAKNGFTEILNSPEDGVIIYDNKTRLVPIMRLKTFALRIASMELTIDVNISQQKTPRIWSTTEDEVFSLKNFISQVDNFEERVLVDKGINVDGTTSAILMPAPFVADKVRIEKQKVKSEAMTFSGIESNASEKKERLIADEVKASGGEADSKLNARFRERQKAVEQINEMFGLDVKVELNDEIGGLVTQMFGDGGGGDE
jgi:hypothetical protein